MKKTFIVLMLSISIQAELCAQSKSKEDKAFEVPENIVINRRFYIDLEKGNKLTIELTDITDLQRIANIDSLLRVFANDLTPLKDSLSDPIASKRIDYVIDAQGRKKIRILRYPSRGDNYLLNNGELSSLKINQDTINIIGVITNPPKEQKKISLTNPRYYHLLFYLNNFDELAGYMNGVLAGKISTIQKQVNGRWPILKGGGSHYLKPDKGIVADKPKGFTPSGTGDFLAAQQWINIQNYNCLLYTSPSPRDS